jgi:hypothetical protein
VSHSHPYLRNLGLAVNSFFFFFCGTGVELRVFTLSHSTSTFFVKGFFEVGSRELFAPGWLRIAVLLMSAS